MALLMFVSVSACSGRDPQPVYDTSVVRMVGVGFEDVVSENRDWKRLSSQLDDVGANGVSIAVGRPEWVAFPWPERRDTWAGQVADDGESRGHDFVQEAIDGLAPGEAVQRRSLTLAIDALAPRLIENDPAQGAVMSDGSRSTEFPSATSWATGQAGQNLVALCEQTAQRYTPDRIALTELILQESFGEDDLALFTQMTGRDDWPRDDSGAPDNDAEEVQRWRSQVITDLVSRCADSARKHGVQIEMDARIDWDDPARGRPDSGHDYELLLPKVDRLTVWAYVGLTDREAVATCHLVDGLDDGLPAESAAKVTTSVGLWAGENSPDGDVVDMGRESSGDGDQNSVLSPEAFGESVRCASTRGNRNTHVTPVSLMGDGHWQALKEAWGAAAG